MLAQNSTRAGPASRVRCDSCISRDVDTMLFQCWPIVYDSGPALKQHWFSAMFYWTSMAKGIISPHHPEGVKAFRLRFPILPVPKPPAPPRPAPPLGELSCSELVSRIVFLDPIRDWFCSIPALGVVNQDHILPADPRRPPWAALDVGAASAAGVVSTDTGMDSRRFMLGAAGGAIPEALPLLSEAFLAMSSKAVPKSATVARLRIPVEGLSVVPLTPREAILFRKLLLPLVMPLPAPPAAVLDDLVSLSSFTTRPDAGFCRKMFLLKPPKKPACPAGLSHSPGITATASHLKTHKKNTPLIISNKITMIK